MSISGYNDYVNIASRYSVVPVYREISADMETPVSIFLKTGGSFLLESVERGDQAGRYSIIGIGKKCSIVIRGSTALVTEFIQGSILSEKSIVFTDPLEVVREYMATYSSPDYPDLPPFWGGLVGYLGYEIASSFENISTLPISDSDVPDAVLIVPEALIVCDGVKRSATVIISTFPGEKPETAYKKAEKEIEKYITLISGSLNENESVNSSSGVVKSTTPDREGFIDIVRKCKENILAGDIIQGVLSRKIVLSSTADPFSLYRNLRRVNPSPYMFFLDFEDFSLIGSSPEVMVKVQNGELFLKPIAGTRPRGGTVKEDMLLSEELLSDRKECSEHLMLVDLGRNDLGRVAVPGSVEVTDYMSIERFSHVMHIVSSVKGYLKPGSDAFDVIRAAFPAGTLTGAPKIRAMQIISHLEGQRRGPYGGMVLYLGFNGNLDSCITIRSMVWTEKEITVQAGAGIVADSDPEREFQETENKAQALISVIVNDSGKGAQDDTAHR